MSSSPKARSHPTAPAGLKLRAHEVAHAVDEEDDVYLLSVSCSDRREHVVRFDSGRPGIKEMRWNDSLF